MLLKSISLATLGALVLAAPISAHAKPLDGHYNYKSDYRYERQYKHPGTIRVRYRHGRRIATRRIDRRIRRQSHRIQRGRRVGDLTRHEFRKLKHKLFKIRMVRRSARYDGRVTRYERRRLYRMLDRNSRRIRRLRHNGRHANY